MYFSRNAFLIYIYKISSSVRTQTLHPNIHYRKNYASNAWSQCRYCHTNSVSKLVDWHTLCYHSPRWCITPIKRNTTYSGNLILWLMSFCIFLLSPNAILLYNSSFYLLLFCFLSILGTVPRLINLNLPSFEPIFGPKGLVWFPEHDSFLILLTFWICKIDRTSSLYIHMLIGIVEFAFLSFILP